MKPDSIIGRIPRLAISISLLTIAASLVVASIVSSCGGESSPGGGAPSKILMGGTIQGVPLNLSKEVSTLAGSSFGYMDGTGTAAQFNLEGITTDGTNLYVADAGNNRIRQIVIATGVVTTLAGDGTAGYLDGIGTSAQFSRPRGITTDGANLYVADTSNCRIRQIDIATGVVTTLAGSIGGYLDGTGTAAKFNFPYAITTDGTNLYVTDYGNARIRQIVIATGAVTTLAGDGTLGYLDGIGTAAQFREAFGITTDGINLYVTDRSNNVIRQIVITTGVVTTLAGSLTRGYLDGTGTTARFWDPFGITTDGASLYVGDALNHRIRQIVIATGTVTTLAGDGTAGYLDGTGTAAKFGYTTGITSNGTSLYVAEGGVRIRQIN